MPLYGHELTRELDPFSVGLGSFVKLDKGPFVGREALARRKAQCHQKRIGLELDGKRVAREGAAVYSAGQQIGAVTSGTYSPTLDRPIAMAIIDRERASSPQFEVDLRGRREIARAVKLPFYRRPRAGNAT
jgi:aminomethyltransferase